MPRTEIVSLPPHRSLPSTRASVTDAEAFLTRYLDSSESHPYLHPDAILSTSGVQFSLQGGPKGGITLHNLRRVQAGLRGEYLAPEIHDDADIDEELAAEDGAQDVVETEVPIEEGQDLNADVDMADEETRQDHEVPVAAPSDATPSALHTAEDERNMHDSGADSSSSESEPDDPSRYISSVTIPPREKGQRRKEHRKQNAVSDDSRLDALIKASGKDKKKKKSKDKGDDGKRKREVEVDVEEAEADVKKKENARERKKARKEERRAEKEAKKLAKKSTEGKAKALEEAQDPMKARMEEEEAKRKAEKRARKQAKHEAKMEARKVKAEAS